MKTSVRSRPIARLQGGDRAGFSARLRAGEPAIVRGALAAWGPALSSLEALASGFGTQPLRSYRLPRGSTAQRMSAVKRNFHLWSDTEARGTHLRRWTFGEFLRALQDGEPHYAMANATKNRALRDRLAAHVGRLAILGAPIDPARCDFFFGSSGAGPGLHHDGAVESFVCQLAGRKRVQAFAPSDIAHLYPSESWLSTMGHFSAVADSFAVDLRRFPQFRHATAWRGELLAGDVLYMPPHWFHDPCALGPGATLSIRRDPGKAWGTRREREALAKASAALYESLRPFAPEVRALYAALAGHGLGAAGAKPARRKTR